MQTTGMIEVALKKSGRKGKSERVVCVRRGNRVGKCEVRASSRDDGCVGCVTEKVKVLFRTCGYVEQSIDG